MLWLNDSCQFSHARSDVAPDGAEDPLTGAFYRDVAPDGAGQGMLPSSVAAGGTRLSNLTAEFPDSVATTGTSQAAPTNRVTSLAGGARPVPSGESPDGTGQWPVLPGIEF
jgi:hypothetical protein